MIIGIDATAYSHPQPGGYKTYVANLLNGLGRIHLNHSFCVFLDREIPSRSRPSLPGDSTFVVSNRVPLLRQLLREQVQLPIRALQTGCTVMHYTANTAPAFFRNAYVLTLHDIIQLVEPQASLTWSRTGVWQWLIDKYARLVVPVAARNCRALITVSDFERLQIIKHFKLPPEKVHSIHLAPDPLFRCFKAQAKDAVRNDVVRAMNLEERYLLAIGHEPRKNISSVLRAMARLDRSIARETGLVVVCARKHARLALQDQIAALDLEDRVRVIGQTSREELLRLYNGAAALVFPSLRESFGLPPLEAMACGTPVIASNSSSIPEVLGDAAILVDPTDVSGLAVGIEAVLTDPCLIESLRERGLKRSGLFSWEITARKTVDIYEAVAGGN